MIAVKRYRVQAIISPKNQIHAVDQEKCAQTGQLYYRNPSWAKSKLQKHRGGFAASRSKPSGLRSIFSCTNRCAMRYGGCQ
jgi:hypothetical protein